MNGMQMQAPPHDALGWGIVIFGSIATLWTMIAACYYTLRPGETGTDHPKRLILRNDR